VAYFICVHRLKFGFVKNFRGSLCQYTAMAQTFSNMTAESSVRRKKRDKGKFMVNGDETLDAPAAQAETSVAGPSKLATVTTESTKLRSKRKVPSNADISLSAKDVPWQCVPIAQSEVSTVPPIWSKDGR